MANDLVTLHRSLQPDDPRSDDAISQAYAQSPQAAQYATAYPQWASEVGLTAPTPYIPTAGQQLVSGFNAGVSGLESSFYGAGALGAATVGATGARDYLLAKAQAADQNAAENPPTIPTIGDIHSGSDLASYAGYKIGGIIPNVAEAGVTGLAGAAAGAVGGALLDPAGGEAVGAGGGLLYGILESQATKALIKQAAETGVGDALTGQFVKQNLPAAIKSVASNYGAKASEILNFWTQSAGSTYNVLAKNPDVDPATAINVSILGGLAQAVPSAYLPSTVLGKFFGEGASANASYFARLASQAAKVIPGGAAAMSMQELAAIASEKYADPKTRADAFDLSTWTDADKSRLLESSVTGGLMGLGVAPFAAIPQGKADETPPPAPKINDLIKNYTGDLPANELQDLVTLASRELTGTLGVEGKQTLANLTPEQRNAYPVIKQSVEKGFAKPAESAPPKPSEADIKAAYDQLDEIQKRSAQPFASSTPVPIGELPVDQLQDIAANRTPPPEEEPPAAATTPAPSPTEPPTVANPATVAPPAAPVSAPTITQPVLPNDALARARARAAQALSTEAPKPMAPGSPGSPADEYGAIYGPRITPEQSTALTKAEGNWYDLESPPGTKTTLKVKPGGMLWVESSQPESPGSISHDVGVAYLKARSDGTTILDASKHGRPIDAIARKALLDFLHSGDLEKNANVTPPGQISNPDAYNPERAADIARYNALKPTKEDFLAGRAMSPEARAEYLALQQKYGGQPPDASDELIAAGKAKQAERNKAVTPEPPTVAPTPEPASAKNAPTAVKQVPTPENFNSVDDLLKFKQQRLSEERELYKEQIGLSDDEAQKLQTILARDGDTSKFEKSLTPDKQAKLTHFFEESEFNKVGHPFQFWEHDRRFKPEDLEGEDKEDLARGVVAAVDKGLTPSATSDRFLYAAIAAKKLKDMGATKSDIARALDKFTTSNSGSQGDKAEYFRSLGKKVNDFLAAQGVHLNQGDLGAKLEGREPSKLLNEKAFNDDTHHQGPITPDLVSSDTPVDTGSRRPDYFEIKPGTSPESLEQDLVNGAASGKEAQQTTKRVTVVKDNETGKVYALSTHMDKAEGQVRITDPEKVGNKRGVTTPLEDFLGKKTASGDDKYTPIASIHLKQAKNALIQEFASREAYDRELGDPAKAKMEEAQGNTRAVEDIVPPNTPFRLPDEPENRQFTPEHAQAIVRSFGGLKDPDELPRDEFENQFADKIKTSPQFVTSILALMKDATDAGATPEEALEAAKKKTYDLLTKGTGPSEEAGGEPPASGVDKGAKGSPVSGSAPNGPPEPVSPQAPAGLSPAERQQEGSKGSKVANPRAVSFPTDMESVGDHVTKGNLVVPQADTSKGEEHLLRQFASPIGVGENASPAERFVAAISNAIKRQLINTFGEKLFSQDSRIANAEAVRIATQIADKLASNFNDVLQDLYLREKARIMAGEAAHGVGVDVSKIPQRIKDAVDIFRSTVRGATAGFTADHRIIGANVAMASRGMGEIGAALDALGFNLSREEKADFIRSIYTKVGGVADMPERRASPYTLENGVPTYRMSLKGKGNSQEPPTNPDALRYRQPGDSKPTDTSARHSQLLDTIHKAALNAGLNVQRIGQDISGLAGEFAKRTGASFDAASRTIAQVVSDVIGKEDVITSLHEVAHGVFSTLPDADQARILAAVDRLSDLNLGIEASADPRIRSANPDSLPRSTLQEERLAESIGANLERQGFDPNKSRGLAQQFVRAVKDLYFRAAMSVQRALFGDSFTNPELATKYFQNKVEAFLAGDYTKRSFIDMLGGGKPSEPMVGRWRNADHDLAFERAGANGVIDYGNIPNSSVSAAEFNNLKFRRPSPPDPDDMHSRQVEVEKQAARFNLKQEILDQAVKDETFTQSLGEKDDPSKTMLGLLGLSAPDEYRKTLAGVVEQDGKPVQFDPDKTIDGFKAKSNEAAVTADAYRDVQSDLSKVSRVKTEARDDVRQLTDRRERLLQAHNDAEKNYTDVQYSTSVATRALEDEGKRLLRDTADQSKRLGSIAQQLRAIDPTADLKKYAGVFQKLFTGDELKGEKLYSVLDTMANDPKIDFSKPITDIRQQMLAQGGKYEKYVQHTPESRALTAAVVSFAKTHAQIMANLELRKVANGAERTKIAASLADLKTKGVNFVKSFRDLPKTAILEDRAKQAYRKSLSKVVSSGRRIERAQQRIIAADAMADVLAKHEARLAGKLDIGAESVFRDGMPYNVPPSADASNGDILKATKTLKLDTSSNEVTSPEEVEADLRQMKAFLDARESKYAAGDFDAKDSVYQGVKRQFEQIASNKNFNLNTLPAQRFLIGLSALPDGKKLADGIGTPAARRVDQRMNGYTSDYMGMTDQAERVGLKTVELEDRLLKLVPPKKANAREWMRTNFLNPAKDVFHHSDDLAEKYGDNPQGLKTAILNRVMSTLLNQDSTKDVVRGHEAEWRKGLEDLLDHQAAAAQWQLDRVKEAGLGVLDPSLKTRNPATGQSVPAVRGHIPKGPYTFPQRMAQNFRTMVGALRGAGWASSEGRSLAHEDFSHIGAAIDSNDEPGARKLVDKYFQDPQHGDQIRNDFFRNIAQSQKESLFPAPLGPDGVTRPPVDVALQHQAYDESGGDALKFAQRMWELHDGQEIAGEEHEDGSPSAPIQTRGGYIQSVMTALADTAQESHHILSAIEPDPAHSETAIKGMSANALIDARSIAHLPSQWFDYHDFDQRDMFKTIERIAAERNFGRQQTVLDNDVRTVANEVSQAQLKWNETQAQIQRENPEATGKALRKLMTDKLGAAEYNRLEKINARADLVPKFVHGVSDYFRKDNAPDGTLRAMTRASHLLGQLMVNQPSSALTLMTQLVDMNIRFGPSKAVLGQTIGNFVRAGKEVAGSLLNAVGVQLKGDADNQLWNDIGLSDPANVRKFSDIFDRLHGEGPLAHSLRAASEVMDTGVGKPSPFVKFRPAGIFNFAGQVADKAITMGVWNLTKGQMAKGVDFYRSNVEHFQDPDFKLSADKLGLKGADKDTFERMTNLMQRWGLNYDDMVRGAMENPDKIGLTNEQAIRLYSMAVSEIALSSNLSTMPTAAYNNNIIRFALPLLGWSFRRMAQVGQIGLNEEGQFEAKKLARGLAGLSVAAAGGLATTALIDQYYQTALGKQRNIRPIGTAPDPKEAALAVMENLNRVGTIGLFGDLANGLINIGGGGDNRIASVDQRVLALSSLQSVQQAISAWINQGYDADYTHVVRPLAGALGGGALLQYIQLGSHALGLDNAESRTIARINVGNYLRVVGRSLNLDVRESDGGSSTPNILSPALTEMELATYANNPGDFRAAYTEAIAKAKELGYDDPVAHVRGAFAERNPLRKTFTSTPTQADYQRILANLPSEGAQDVSQAVNLFNQFSQSIGSKPFDGKVAKAPVAPLTIGQVRQRASLALQ